VRDLLMLLLTAAFFGLCLAYVWWCDRIIGPDPAELTDHDEAAEPAVVGETQRRSPATQADDDRSVAGAPSLASDQGVPL
jgi:hypothetical protein